MPLSRRPLLYLALAVALALVFALSVKVRQLNSTIGDLRRLTRSAQPGQYVPILELVDGQGVSRSLGQPEAGHVQLVFVYRSDCEYCEASALQWRSIHERIRSNPRVEIIAASTDTSQVQADAFLRKHDLVLPRVLLTEERSLATFRIFAVPQIMIVNSNGQISYARAGVLHTGPAVDSVVRAAVELQVESPATTTN